MAATNATATTTNATVDSAVSADELAAKAVNKRYEGLVMVRTKAIKGKGAWYWAHLEPILVQNPDTGLPKAVKLRCSLCDAVFSASNPSRTASEHLKRGTCPKFNSLPKPISPISPSGLASPSQTTTTTPQHNHRKRNSFSVAATSGSGGGGGVSSYQAATPLAIVDPTRFCGELTTYSSSASAAVTVMAPPPHHQLQQHLVLSGGKEDLGALAMLEDSDVDGFSCSLVSKPLEVVLAFLKSKNSTLMTTWMDRRNHLKMVGNRV
ncbi:hypothetical protein HS088_TW15G00363 [Tripterygium wilfordii]|uniref:DUF7963 domain-containing protein n=1 Tax=Tripterygium wilfordii TaxID=458696 RepID=A0A7J7CLE5_TRIWF|nr:hypothetical protein HS088_TW15G00363 [Tripterygium wilfordii]